MTMGIGALSSLFGQGQNQGAQDSGSNGNMMQEIAQLLQAIEQLLDSSNQGQNGNGCQNHQGGSSHGHHGGHSGASQA
jgi:hypothetical protein